MTNQKGLGLALIILLISIVAVGAIIIATVPNRLCDQGSGIVSAEDIPVTEFEQIKLKGSGNIFLTQGAVPSLRISAEDNVLKKMTAEIKNNKLTISRKTFLKCIRPTEPINIYITADNITEMQINGSGKITGVNRLVLDNVDLNINGSGDINLELEADLLETAITGSGKITLKGFGDTQNFTLNGSGGLNAPEFITDNSSITINGSGRAEVNTDMELKILINGSGEVLYHGDPESINQKINGSGKIQKLPSKTDERGAKNSIKQAFIKKYPEQNWENTMIQILESTGKHARGLLGGAVTADSGYWYATKTAEGWRIVADGNGAITCTDIEPFDFPVFMIAQCWDSETESLIPRE